ncbi:PAS domain-containing protein [Candidatus Paraluminiphilus aquimaris]|uniref:histidine kinase n=1 Tax=Candidatus Paraluminiphilus aquimaris TaxID=2518994 RepID=A0ABY6Q995_9GAMM|nr:ATP-binding protein [Candidatus Paraluminiphilus aquimaris]UZP75501.1 PAS domain-containing protein [Candidatus Paraluminiphilus aquimaris]
MNLKSLFLRILLIMGGLYLIATLVVMSINLNYFQAQQRLVEASEKFILLSRDKEELSQILALNEQLPDSHLDILLKRSLPLDCCQSEYAFYLSAVSAATEIDRSDLVAFRISESWEQFLRAADQALANASNEVDQLRGFRDSVVPTSAISLLILSLFLAFTLISRHLISPLESLTGNIRHLVRGGEQKPTEFSAAVSELRFLQEAFESVVNEYRGSLRSRGQNASEMSKTSDALEAQFQKLVELAERPAFILDASGAIRTWNKRMVTLTGVARSQSSRTIFSEVYLDGRSKISFDDAFQTARRGGRPDELHCELRLKGGRIISSQLQLSPQIESMLGVNRVLVMVTSDTYARSVPKGSLSEGQLTEDGGNTPSGTELRLLTELSSSLHWLTASAAKPVETEIARQHAALMASIKWVGSRAYESENSEINLTELVSHFASVFEPKLLDLDLKVAIEVRLAQEPVLTTGNAGGLLVVLEKLSDNALEAIRESTPASARIAISASSDEDGIARISIKDNGGGAPRGDDRYLLDPFYTTRAAQGHHGLGLTHSRDLIKQMSGDLTVINDIERGELEIVIELPLSGA